MSKRRSAWNDDGSGRDNMDWIPLKMFSASTTLPLNNHTHTTWWGGDDSFEVVSLGGEEEEKEDEEEQEGLEEQTLPSFSISIYTSDTVPY